jgi:uncharacterized membrane protein
VHALPLILTVFIACAVEAVEALTIVLAAGVTREWRSTFQGMAAALVTLAVITAAVGPAINDLPLTALRVIVGALLAIFGLQWLRKAVLRATGYKALHDEASAYLREVAAAEAATKEAKRGVRDWYAFTLAFKGVLLEGLEVVFIVITFGANQKNIGAAVIGAAAAIVVVTIGGIAVRAPLTKVPENWMKLAVGVMLTSCAGPATTPPCWCSSRWSRCSPPPASGGCARARRPSPYPPVPRRLSADEAAQGVRRVLVRLHRRRRLAGGRPRGGGAGAHRHPDPRRPGERVVAAAGRRLRRPRLVPAPGHGEKVKPRCGTDRGSEFSAGRS